jgi:phage baseplate assembly protein W
MATYIGFSTINANKPKTTNPVSPPNGGFGTDQIGGLDGGFGSILEPLNWGKKFRLVDAPLVIQDFLNALNIPKGQKVGQPAYGTTLWSFLFEPNTRDVQFQLENEIRRLASEDPRMTLAYVKSFPKENGILIELQVAINPYNQPAVVNIYFDRNSRSAGLI